MIGDQCMYGLAIPNADRSGMVTAKKPTRFMSNGWYILKELDTKCDKSHTHQALMGGRASKAHEYTYMLCRAMCRGFRKQKGYDRSGKVSTDPLGHAQLSSLVKQLRQWQDDKIPEAVPSPVFAHSSVGICSGS